MFTFSIIDVQEVEISINFERENILGHIEMMSKEPHSMIHPEAKDKNLAYMADYLETLNIMNEDNLSKAGYQIQEEFYNKDNGYVQSFDIKNLIVTIPATSRDSNTEALLFMAHHDSVPMGNGASDDLVPVGGMLEAIRYYKDLIDNKGYQLTNDLVFAIVDCEEYALGGSEIFMKRFDKFDNVVDRVKLAVNLESRGTSGTLILFQVNQNNYELLRVFAKINQNIFTSSIANFVYNNMPNYTDYDNFKDAWMKLNMANIGEGENYHTQNDNFENIGNAYLTQTAHIIDGIIHATSDVKLSSLEGGPNSVFYSYLNLNLVYVDYAAIIFASLLCALLVANIVMAIIKRQNKIKDILRGMALFVITIGGAALTGLVTYYTLGSVAALAGVVDIHQITKISYTNPFLITVFMFFTIGMSLLFYRLMNKVLKVPPLVFRKIVTYFYAIISAMLGFILFEASYLFLLPAALLLVLELTHLLLRNKFPELFKLNFELFIFALSVPLTVPVVFLATSALGAGMAYLYGIIILLFSAYILPLIDRQFDRLREKKFKPIMAIATLNGVLLITMCIGSGIKGNLSANLSGKQNISRYYYDDALMYYIENNQTYLMVKDLDAYPYLKGSVPGMKYVSKHDAYMKDYPHTYIAPDASVISFSFSSNELSVDRSGVHGVTEITIINYDDVIDAEITYTNLGETFKFDVSSTLRKIVLTEDATIKFGGSVAQLSINDALINYEPLLDLDAFKGIKNIENAKYNYIHNYEF